MTRADRSQTLRDSLGDLAPKLVDLTNDVVFGDVWERSMRSRDLVRRGRRGTPRRP